MTGLLRLLILVAGAVAAVVLFFVFRGDDDGGRQAQTTQTTGTTTEATQTEVERPAVFTINARTPRIKRIAVDRNRMVVISVVADRSEEVHLHGYDVKSDATPTRPARFAFRADRPGRFELEFEGSGQQIAELTVNP